MAGRLLRGSGRRGCAIVIGAWLAATAGCGPDDFIPSAPRETTVGAALANVQYTPSLRTFAHQTADVAPDPSDDPAANWLAQIVDACNQAASGAEPRDQRVLRHVARVSDALSNARLSYIDSFTEVLPTHAVELKAFEKPEQIRTLIERFHAVRMQLHGVHVQLSECEMRLANGLIDEGVDADAAHAEAASYASGARLSVLDELFTLERHFHDALQTQLQFLLDQWGVWEVSTADPDLIYGVDHVFEEFDRHRRRISTLWGQLNECVFRLSRGA